MSMKNDFRSDIVRMNENQCGMPKDVKILTADDECEGEARTVGIMAHKFILAARSPVFMATLHSGMQESFTHEIDMTDFSATAVKRFISFLYGVEGTDSDLIQYREQLLFMADKYNVPELFRCCESCCTCNLTCENALTMLAVADSVRAHKLKTAALTILVAHPEQVKRSISLGQVGEGVLRDLVVAFADHVQAQNSILQRNTGSRSEQSPGSMTTKSSDTTYSSKSSSGSYRDPYHYMH